MNNNSTREALVDAIPAKVHEFMDVCTRLGPEPWLDLDLTMKQLKVLLVLTALGPSRPNVIATSIGASAANATGVLDRLVTQGYVERQPDPADRRALLVRLTPAGEHTVSELRVADQNRLRGPLLAMSDDDLNALYRGVTALIEAARRVVGAESPLERMQSIGKRG